jgi:hypothetical protein
MSAIYRLRFFFDYCAGTCLWSANDAAHEALGYAVDYKRLPLSPATVDEIDRVVDRYDTSLNWASPADPGPWRQDECDRFNQAVAALFERIRAELGDMFDVYNEYIELEEDPDLDRYLMAPQGFQRQ